MATSQACINVQVWPGALVLSKIMVEDMDRVVRVLEGLQTARMADEGEDKNMLHLLQEECSSPDQVKTSTLDDSAGALETVISRWSWQDMNVVELGCGLALCTVVAACLGARALATDGDSDLVRIAKRNIAENTHVSGIGKRDLKCKAMGVL